MEFDNIWNIIRRLELLQNSAQPKNTTSDANVRKSFENQHSFRNLVERAESNILSRTSNSTPNLSLGLNDLSLKGRDLDKLGSGIKLSRNLTNLQPTQTEIFLGCFCLVSGYCFILYRQSQKNTRFGKGLAELFNRHFGTNTTPIKLNGYVENLFVCIEFISLNSLTKPDFAYKGKYTMK